MWPWRVAALVLTAGPRPANEFDFLPLLNVYIWTHVYNGQAKGSWRLTCAKEHPCWKTPWSSFITAKGPASCISLNAAAVKNTALPQCGDVHTWQLVQCSTVWPLVQWVKLVNALVSSILNLWIQHWYGGCVGLILLNASNGVLISLSMQVCPHIYSVILNSHRVIWMVSMCVPNLNVIFVCPFFVRLFCCWTLVTWQNHVTGAVLNRHCRDLSRCRAVGSLEKPLTGCNNE